MTIALRLGACAFIAALLHASDARGQSQAPAAADSGGATTLVATVADLAIDADHFREGVRRLLGKEREVGELSMDQRRKVLGALIDARLVALEAQRRGLGLRESVQAAVRDAERTAVNEVMYRREVEEKLQITPEDVREQYALWGAGEVVKPAHILVATREAADSVLAALDGGGDFGELARQRSTHGGSSLRHGSMGYLRRYLIPDRLREHIWDLPAGRVYPEPIHTIMGYHVVKVLGRGHQTLEQQEQAIRGFLGRKGRAILERDLHARLRVRYGYEWRGATVARLIRQGPTASADSVLARWQGGELTLAEYRQRASGPDVSSADASSMDTSRLHQVVDELSAEELIHLECRARRWDRLPEVGRRIEEARLQALGQALFESLGEGDPASEEEIRAFYDRHRSSYGGPDRLTVQEILVRDRATADSLHALIHEGADMADLARRHSIREETRQTGGIWEEVDKYGHASATVYRVAMAGEGLMEPVQLPTGNHSIIRVLAKEPGLPLELEEVEEAVRADLQTLAMDRLISGLRRQFRDRVSTDEQALGDLR